MIPLYFGTDTHEYGILNLFRTHQSFEFNLHILRFFMLIVKYAVKQFPLTVMESVNKEQLRLT